LEEEKSISKKGEKKLSVPADNKIQIKKNMFLITIR